MTHSRSRWFALLVWSVVLASPCPGQDTLFEFFGSFPLQLLGAEADGVGDVNNDGVPDFLVGYGAYQRSTRAARSRS